MNAGIAFIDLEVGADGRVLDYGAFREPDRGWHGRSAAGFGKFIEDAEYLCGHNLVHHDLKHLSGRVRGLDRKKAIDTLYLSPLLFPKKPYHRLLKDDKLQSEDLNNPLNDAQKARDLFWDEVRAFGRLPDALKSAYCSLLAPFEEFRGFFAWQGTGPGGRDAAALAAEFFAGRICAHAPLAELAETLPRELAYALALVNTGDPSSLTPAWVLRNFPRVESVLKALCGTPCAEGCAHCRDKLDIRKGLRRFFGYDAFRLFDGEPLQERAVQAAVDGKPLLAIFPTGGGKSLTFQLPALMQGRAEHGLTVVISPLQSLMKDQVDNLAERGIAEAATINGLLDPLSRKNAIERVQDGTASLLYISPEMLRSKTIEKLLRSRNVVRFVIDEAHCFSAWGQDFRVDYLYIGEFIRNLQKTKSSCRAIPVSCFTATAKPKVISDIREYFRSRLGQDLQLFASGAARTNLRYEVRHTETEEEKYRRLRELLLSKECPTIVYVSRRKKTGELAGKLTRDGILALPFHGKMEPGEKVANQNAFMRNEVRVIVATSAFGMGVDKQDVGLVVHYNISDSLENYVQEAGRAGRDPHMHAECHVLYGDQDLDMHFRRLNQDKLSIGEIQQVWSAIKKRTRRSGQTACSALEIAREAGWDDEKADIETHVRAAIAALEEAGYVRRGNNVPHVFASGITVKNMEEARHRIERSPLFDGEGRQNAIRVIGSLISSKAIANARDGDAADSRVDYLADILGMEKKAVIDVVTRMRQEGILADTRDMSAWIDRTENAVARTLNRFDKLERFLLGHIADSEDDPGGQRWVSGSKYKWINEKAVESGIADSSVKNIRTLLYFLSIQTYIRKKEDSATESVRPGLAMEPEAAMRKQARRIEVCRFVVHELCREAALHPAAGPGPSPVEFSVTELLKEMNEQTGKTLFGRSEPFRIREIEEALLYLSKIGAMKLEGGFLVIYNAMEIRRLADMKRRYKLEDYRLLDEFYRQKIQQIHIVGEYANLMVRDYAAAQEFVRDYFRMDYRQFIARYFKGERRTQIERNITPAQYQKLVGGLSESQRAILDDKDSKCIVVAAGPGSGKTRVLVHKLASVLQLEDVKSEQLLMLTFSRAAAVEFKRRLVELVGAAAYPVEIKTFHSYCFDLLGRVGNLEDAGDAVGRAVRLMEKGGVEPGRIAKSVLVLDEAQDMNAEEFALVRALMRANETMRVIAVGDDDQTIYDYRYADSRYMRVLARTEGCHSCELSENYRSAPAIVDFANAFARTIRHRLKTRPCTAVRHDLPGSVRIVHHASPHLVLPVVEEVKNTWRGETACVLTRTNEEAAQVVGALEFAGIHARLIQSADGVRFCDLVEVSHFFKRLDAKTDSPVLSGVEWEEAKAETLERYKTSRCLGVVREYFRQFESVHRTRYKSDAREFAYDSKLEDFDAAERGTLLVSTIHKAKGREFDTVYVLLHGEQAVGDAARRKLYVAITRPRNRLFIHCDTDVFKACRTPSLQFLRVDTVYPEPPEIRMQLTHADVWLDFSKGRQKAIFALRSGDPLTCSGRFLFSKSGTKVAALSNQKRKELARWGAKGYAVVSAAVGYVVVWKGKEDSQKTAVVLPILKLRKKGVFPASEA